MLIIIHIAICVFLIGVILIQPGKSDMGIGFGSTSSQSIFGSKGAGNFLTKTTSIFAIVYLGTSFFLTRQRLSEMHSSVVAGEKPAAESSSPPPTTPPPSGGESQTPEKPAEEKKP